jgi:hypothetical protein
MRLYWQPLHKVVLRSEKSNTKIEITVLERRCL